MGPDLFYEYMIRFGFGQPTRVDLMSEALGQMPLPGDKLWTETSLGTNSFGQGMATTPLQMLAAISALANEGTIMQPYLVQEVHTHDGQVYRHEPAVSSRPISPETAQQVTAMAVNAVRREVPNAQVEGFTVAGKTSSAQIPEGGVYDPNDIIGVFVGWLPADNPELLIMVKLDRPQSAPRQRHRSLESWLPNWWSCWTFRLTASDCARTLSACGAARDRNVKRRHHIAGAKRLRARRPRAPGPAGAH